MSQTVYLNGSYLPLDQAQISVLDRGFLFGDSVYEVIPIYGGRAFRLTEHLQRLDNSLNAIRISSPHSHQQWSEIIDRLLLESDPDSDYGVYLQVSRGAGAKRDHLFPANINPTVFVMANPIPEPDLQKQHQGIAAITYADVRWHLCNIKSTSLLANVLLKQQAHEQAADEAILIRDGEAMEGSASNLFVINNGQIKTPAKSNHLLPGITRDLVVELANENQIPLAEAAIFEEELQVADEIWMTSSTKEIMPVTQLNGKAVADGKPGPLWKQMINLYQDCKQKLRSGEKV